MNGARSTHDDQTGFVWVTYTSQVITQVANSLVSPAFISAISSRTTESSISSPVSRQPRSNMDLQTGYPTITVSGLIRSGSAPWYNYNDSGIYLQPRDQTTILTKVLASTNVAKKDTAVMTSKFTSEWYSSGVTLVTNTDRTVRHMGAQFYYNNCRSSQFVIFFNVLMYSRYTEFLVIRFWRPLLL